MLSRKVALALTFARDVYSFVGTKGPIQSCGSQMIVALDERSSLSIGRTIGDTLVMVIK